jgi:hypothetical protein
MLLDQLTHVREELERLEPLIEAREDDHSAQQLACAVKAARREIASFEADGVDADVGRELLACGRAALERVWLYAEAWGLDWAPRRDSQDTVVLTAREVLAIVHGMPAGASGPPAELAETLQEAQMVGRHSTVPAPPPFDPERETGDFSAFADDLEDDDDEP